MPAVSELIMANWKALTARISLFPIAPGAPSALDLYKSVWGGDPDGYQKGPNAFAPSIAQGVRGGIAVSCNTQPARIDFTYAPTPTGDGSVPTLFLIENGPLLNEDLRQVIEAIGTSLVDASINRVALFVQFSNIGNSVVAANRTLMEVVPQKYKINIDDEDSLIIQINNIKNSSSVQNMHLNLIDKWSVEKIQLLSFAITGPENSGPAANIIQAGAPTLTRTTVITSSVSFDYNSNPSEAPISSADQAAILGEALGLIGEAQRASGLDIEGF